MLVKYNKALPSMPTYMPGNYFTNLNEYCDTHSEVLRYLCETCKIMVCTDCTLRSHKDHNCLPLSMIGNEAKDKIRAILESGKLGTKCIKGSIDRALAYSQAVERDSNECSARIKKAMRHFISAAEDRERVLLERIDKYRSHKLSSLNEQMMGLREALSGLSQTSEQLNKAYDTLHMLSEIEIATILVNGEIQMENAAAIYKSLQERSVEEFLNFINPNFELLQQIRVQGEILLSSQRGQMVIQTAQNQQSNGGGGGVVSSRRASLKGMN